MVIIVVNIFFYAYGIKAMIDGDFSVITVLCVFFNGLSALIAAARLEGESKDEK